ncbi:hypothetical protein CRD60_08330, partial [Bifidobacterium aemilianum]
PKPPSAFGRGHGGPADDPQGRVEAGERISVETLDLGEDTLARIRALPQAQSADYDGLNLVVRCRQGEHNLQDVLATLEASGSNYGHLTSRPPSLNDVFLELTGKELRD